MSMDAIQQEEEQGVAERQAMALSNSAQSLIIESNEDRISAEALLESAANIEKTVFAFLDPPRAKAYEQYQYHKKRLDDYLNPVKDAKKIIKQKCMDYDREQERIRQEAQRIAEEAARNLAEEEQLAAAIQAEQLGDKDTAEAIISEPVNVAPVMVPKTAPTASRLSAGRSIWSAEQVNLMMLIKAVADGKQPITLLEPNMTAINGIARSLKNGFNIPGFIAVEKRV